MSFDDALCWALDCFEEDLEPLRWRYSFDEFRGRLRRKIGEFATSHLQQVHGFAKIVSMALGPAKKQETVITDIDEFNRMAAGG